MVPSQSQKDTSLVEAGTSQDEWDPQASVPSPGGSTQGCPEQGLEPCRECSLRQPEPERAFGQTTLLALPSLVVRLQMMLWWDNGQPLDPPGME